LKDREQVFKEYISVTKNNDGVVVERNNSGVPISLWVDGKAYTIS